ncbi:MAG: hypothetical protein K0R38_3219 [Polyangiaceae bacterium]|jgi:hypothetical protein|nr:hypothetical protein [Polyangiaceae bacterium]
MQSSVTISIRSSEFQRAFLALGYFFGARGPVLAEPLAGVGLQSTSADVLRGLCHEERSERAKTLAVELGRLATALDERGLWR